MIDSFIESSTGKTYFRQGENIYINKSREPFEDHLHVHDFIEVSFVVSGIGLHRIGNIEQAVSRGDLFVINYATPHQFKSIDSDENKRLNVYNCIFNPEFLDYALINCRDFSNFSQHFLFKSVFPDVYNIKPDVKLSENESTQVEQLYEKMHREYRLQQKGYIEILRAYVIELFVTIFRSYNNTNDGHHKESESYKLQMIDDITGYIKENYFRNLKVEELSTMSFFSQSSFFKIFKERTGLTVIEFVQNIRMTEACRLLVETDEKIIAIASQVGYSDIKFFNKLFKRSLNMTPGAYRKNVQQCNKSHATGIVLK